MAKKIYRWKNCTDYSGWASLALILSFFWHGVFWLLSFSNLTDIPLMIFNLTFESLVIIALVLIKKTNRIGMYFSIALCVLAVSLDLLSNGITHINFIAMIKESSIIFFLLFLTNNEFGLNGYQVLNIAKINGQYLKDLIEEEESNECYLKDVTISKTLDNEIRIDKEYYPYSGKILFSNKRGYIRVHEGEAVAYCIMHDNGKSAITQYAQRKPTYFDGTDTHCYMAKEAFLKEYPNIIALKQECLAEFKDILTFNTDDTEQ